MGTPSSPVPPRFQQGPITTALQLGPLASLAGSWAGNGFNAIWRPDNNQPPENSKIHRFLELNLTNESFDFQIIPGVVPNRGFNTQADLSLYQRHSITCSRSATRTRSRPRRRDIRKRPARRCISSPGSS